MPIGKKSLEEMLEEIEFESLVRYDFLIPEEIQYEIMFTFSDYLSELSNFLKPLGVEIADGAGVGDGDCPFSGALANAFVHGNKEEEKYPVTVKVFSGKKGVVLRIRDVGQGFNFNDVQRKFENKQPYYEFCGNGFKTYSSNIAAVSFEGNGSIVNLMYIIGGLTLSQHMENLLFKMYESGVFIRSRQIS